MTIILDTGVVAPLSSSLLSLSLGRDCPAVTVIIVFVSTIVDAPALHHIGCNDCVAMGQR
jgi:hypothetical protein